MPQQAPPEPPESIVLKTFAGLKNTVNAERLRPEDLARALDIDLDDTGAPSSRRGFRRVITGDVHSLFQAANGTVYGIINGDLKLIHPDWSTVTIKAGLAFNPSFLEAISYIELGDLIYFSCPTATGKIVQSTGQVVPWGPAQDIWLSPVVNPTANLPDIRGRLLGAPPRAKFIAYYNGRIYMAQGKVLWATELYLYDYVDKTRTFYTFEHDITGVGAVSDGIYVGTTDDVWYLSGNFSEMKRVNVMNTGMIPGSIALVPGELANPPQIDPASDQPVHWSLVFMTNYGFCEAQEQGVCINYTEAKLFTPKLIRSAALYRRQDGVNQYIVVNDTGGSPSSAARIGDYIDAEIIRGDQQPLQVQTAYFGDVIDAEIVRA